MLLHLHLHLHLHLLLLLMRHSLHLLLLLLCRRLLRRRLIGRILRHLQLEPHLVLSGLCLVLRFLLGCQRTPAFPEDAAHIHKLDSRVLLHHNRSHFVREEHVRTRGPLGGVGTTLGAAFWSRRAVSGHDVLTGMVAGGWYVLRDLFVVPFLVAFGGVGPMWPSLP